MAYLLDIDDSDRQINFAIYNDMEDVEKKAKVTKLTMMRSFLAGDDYFITVRDVCDLLQLNRKTVERHLKSGELKSYKINYFRTHLSNRDDRNSWVEDGDSNLRMIIGKDDLKTFLMDTINASYRRIGVETFAEKADEFKRDSFFKEREKQTGPLKPTVFLEHKRMREETSDLVDDIISEKVVLQSQATLRKLVDKSETTFTRLAKCVDVVRLNFGGKRDTTRMLFKDASGALENIERARDLQAAKNDICEVKASSVIRSISMSPVNIYRVNLSFEPGHDFQEPVDFLSLSKNERKDLEPDGFFITSTGKYLAVEQSKLRSRHINITEGEERIAEENELRAEIVREFAELMSKR